MAGKLAVVYWLFNDQCVCPWRHGYIGATTNWPHRLNRHRRESDFLMHLHFQGQVLFHGTVKQCHALEKQMRPTAGIGWNRYPGGPSGHASKGISKSAEHRAKIQAATLVRYANPEEHKKTSKAVKRGLKNIDRSGENNSMFGRHMSEEAKEKVRAKIQERSITGKKNPNYRHGKFC